MNRILITGGAGYIGTILISKLLQYGYYITVVDNLLHQNNPFNIYATNKRFNFIKGNVCDHRLTNSIIDSNDFIIPLAGVVGIQNCDRYPIQAKNTNYKANIALFNKILTNKIIIYPSSTSVYGKENRLPQIYYENSPIEPISLYAKTKADTEKLFQKLDNVITLRIGAAFGKSYSMRTELTINNLVLQAAKNRIIKLGKHDYINSYIHVNDIAEAIIFSIVNSTNMVGGIFNICSDSVTLSKKQLCSIISDFVPDLQIESNSVIKTTGGTVNINKISNLGWSCCNTLEDGITELIEKFNDAI